MTQAAINHQISRLEDLLGVPLFARNTQGLLPTDEGRLLFQSFDAMSRALGRLHAAREVEVLNLGVNTTFALGWLLPRMTAFRAACPGIDLRVSTHNNRVEILREGLDMAIRFGSRG